MELTHRARSRSTRGAVVALATAMALSGGLLSATGASGAPGPGPRADAARAVPNELLVGYEAGTTPQQRASARSRADAQLEELVVPAAADRAVVELVRIPAGLDRAAAARDLEAAPAVAYAEPNWIYTTDAVSTDTYYTSGSLWGMYGDATSPANQFGSQAGEAWGTGHTGSNSVYVGIIDEGIQFTHPDLDANVWTNQFDASDGRDNDGNGYVDDTHGWDFANNDATIYDGGPKGNLDNHGTHVSGTIGAEANGAGVVGVNWNVKLISGKFLGRNGGTTTNAIKAVDYFTDLKTRHGLNIVATNNSWGGGGFSQALKDAIDRANAKNILFIAAAGNGGSDGVGDNNDIVASYPSNYASDNVVAVAAITSTGARSSFSNYGATTVDIGAPGSGIYSTLAGNKYGSYSGTSMATPHVTGAAALYASTHPGATAAQIKATILGAAVPTPSLAGKVVTGGRLNVSGF
ncbi:MAG: S8 family peptidase [Acidimicrobiales bacterium]